MKIKAPLSFIQKDGLVEFDIQQVKGVRHIIAPGFKQLIKQSEYEKIMANEVKPEVIKTVGSTEGTESSLPFETVAGRGKRK